MENITDNLLSGLSDGLTKETELFLLNSVADKDTQQKIIELINKSFNEGAQTALEFYDKAREEFQHQASSFQKDFHNKLFDGQDKPVSE